MTTATKQVDELIGRGISMAFTPSWKLTLFREALTKTLSS